MIDMSVRKAVPVAALLVLTAAVFAQTARRDGKWEVTTQVEMPGMPAGRGMPGMSNTVTQCITKEQADDPQKFAAQPPSRGGQQSDCKVSDYKVVGNKVTYSMKCTTPQEMTATGEMVYGENKYDGVVKMTMSRGGQTMDMTMKMAGKRLGDCTP
jgi:hypothetical protein